MSQKTMRKLQVAKAIEDGVHDVEDIAQCTGIKERLVFQYVKELLSETSDNITPEDSNAMLKEALISYQLIETEAIKSLTSTDKHDEKLKAIELWRKTQQSRDQLFKASGIYSERKEIEITDERIRQSSRFQQIAALYNDYLIYKGLDPAKFHKWVKDKAQGKIPDKIDMDKMEKDSHRPAIPQYEMGYDKGSPSAEKLGLTQKEIAEGKLLKGSLTDIQEEQYLRDLTDTEKEEWLSLKKKVLEEEAREKEEET